jgi:hypothetical protein
MRAWTGAVAGTFAAAALAAGCGGGGGGDRLTKEEYIQQADAICADATEQIDALGQPQSLEDLAAMTKQAVAIAADQLEKLRALVPPEEIEEQVNRAYDLLEQQNGVADEIVAAAEAGDAEKIQQLVDEAAPLEQEGDDIAANIGLQECGSEGA